ncbi:polysaccharide deacetylase family protein [Akkermansiaceae bacterium]|nr:polysaccharide deacetylase family protein [Akkermansiaceae bacterium]
MKKTLKKLYTQALGSFYNPGSNTVILNGHDFNMGDGKVGNKKERADRLLKQLSKKYKLLDLAEALHNIEEKKTNKAQIAFTFDDGFKECLEIAEVFNDRELSVGFFLSTKYHLGGYSGLPLDRFNKAFLDIKDIKNIHNMGHIIGAHTHTHLSLSEVTHENFHNEILKPKEIIEEVTNHECRYFAAPYGVGVDLDPEIISGIREVYQSIFWSNNKNRGSFEKGGLNRRHFELNWSYRTVNYFLSKCG